MDALVALFGGPNTSFKNTHKKYWDRYAYKVEVKRISGLGWPKMNAEMEAALTDAKGHYRSRREGNYIAYFFETKEDAIAFATPFKGRTPLAFAGPESDAACRALSDSKARIRENLWWHKYRWRLSSSYRHFGHTEAMTAWLNENCGERWALGANYPMVVYFEHEHDVLMFKCMFGEYIATIEEAILTKDLV